MPEDEQLEDAIRAILPTGVCERHGWVDVDVLEDLEDEDGLVLGVVDWDDVVILAEDGLTHMNIYVVCADCYYEMVEQTELDKHNSAIESEVEVEIPDLLHYAALTLIDRFLGWLLRTKHRRHLP